MKFDVKMPFRVGKKLYQLHKNTIRECEFKGIQMYNGDSIKYLSTPKTEHVLTSYQSYDGIHWDIVEGKPFYTYLDQPKFADVGVTIFTNLADAKKTLRLSEAK